ncbi:hypothetical protein ABIF29_006237 [Bradyrhizobium elkanii]|uniref:Uncharacterized protein n=1 Tax=Bradyrhizobium elkanii TaxID=29448 RepID=A0ABV4F7J0_BRAEL|nr:hypothetical protein [Bradyrhizobium elkanii]MCP1976781.1 hypothetical protein [Bradyrhizobium elkanii]MCS3888701.1 hypothetical protein [Bradyrhizobium elkanii]MCS4212277.1 hypothetical protein [Bradyrhizobium elkanii]MCW2192089.1 hypothetical protein [Bradyrhizobium elkanii]
MEQLPQLPVLKLKPGSAPAIARMSHIFAPTGETASDFLPRPVTAPLPDANERPWAGRCLRE